jgi:hypothetical protein
MTEFTTLLERIDRVDGKLDALQTVVTAHVAASEAIPKRRAATLSILAVCASYAGVAVALYMAIRR